MKEEQNALGEYVTNDIVPSNFMNLDKTKLFYSSKACLICGENSGEDTVCINCRNAILRLRRMLEDDDE